MTGPSSTGPSASSEPSSTASPPIEPSTTGESPIPDLVIRRMTTQDVDAVAALEAGSFSTPWDADTFTGLLERAPVELWVGELGGEVVAYSVLWCIGEEGELANLAVSPEHRGKGIGGRLLDEVLEVARERGVFSLYLEVRESNEGARALYRSRRFQEVGRRKSYYDRPREDARVLVVGLVPPGLAPHA
ncbi:MAG: ribosomal protein S18-alanine N-acetyltransferase [Gemmatimonadota bacterium]